VNTVVEEEYSLACIVHASIDVFLYILSPFQRLPVYYLT